MDSNSQKFVMSICNKDKCLNVVGFNKEALLYAASAILLAAALATLLKQNNFNH